MANEAEQGDLNIVGKGIGQTDRLGDLIDKMPKGMNEDDALARIQEADPGDGPEAPEGRESDYGSDDDLFLDIDPATRPPQFEPNRQAGETLGAWQQRLQQEAATFDRDFQSINWEELRQDDPQEFAARMQEFQERRAAFDARFKDFQSYTREHEQSEQARYQEHIAEHLARERQLAVDKIPSWRDEGRRLAELAEMKQYLRTEYGYSDEDINQVADHRHLVLIRKALQWDRRQKQEPVHARARLKQSRPRQQQDWTDTLTPQERKAIERDPHGDTAHMIRISRML